MFTKPQNIIEFVTFTKNQQNYLYPYIMSKSTFNTYVTLGILSNTAKHYFKLLDD